MFGYWDAIYFVFVFIIGLLLAYLLERWAKRSGMGTRETGDGTKIFISGEDPEKVIPGFEHLEGHYTGRNVMWGGLTYALRASSQYSGETTPACSPTTRATL